MDGHDSTLGPHRRALCKAVRPSPGLRGWVPGPLSRPVSCRQCLRCRGHPQDKAVNPKRSPRSTVHAASREVREAFKQAYRQFAELFRWAAQELRAGKQRVEFPSHQAASHPASPTSRPKRHPRSTPRHRAIRANLPLAPGPVRPPPQIACRPPLLAAV
jgi:hypothetical protein